MRRYSAIPIFLIFIALLLLSTANCGGPSSVGNGGQSETLQQISIAPQNPTLAKGADLQLTAKATYSDGKTQDVTQSVSWKTSNATIVTVGSNGALTAISVGSAQVSASYQGLSTTDAVTIGPATLVSIAVSPSSSSLPVGASEQLIATGTFTDQSTQDLTQSANWSSSVSSAATVNSTGLATAKATGNTTITATVGNTSGSASVAATPAALVSLTVTPASSSLPLGDSEQLTATGTFTDQSTRDLTQSATWSSSGSLAVAVNSTGVASARSIGNTTITAAIGSTQASAQVTTTAAVPVSLNISPTTVFMVIGSSQQLRALVTYSDGTTQDVTLVAQWSSSADDIVSLNALGFATATQVGQADITAAQQSLTATVPVTVAPLALTQYFDLSTAQASDFDPTVFITNPGLVNADLCAMIYVFDQRQEMNECCGCRLSDSGLLTLSLKDDLTANPLTGVKPNSGTIRIVSSDSGSNTLCDPTLLAPSGLLLGSATHVRINLNGSPEFVETDSLRVPLPSTESTGLINSCTAIRKLGGSHGVCSCGKTK